MRTAAAFALLSLIVSTPLRAETTTGHYYLEGVMETGSELLLRPDSKFQYYFVYGALDLAAEGDWREEKGHVLLTTRTRQSNAPNGEPQVFDRLDMTIARTPEGKPALEADLWGRHVTYVRHSDAEAGN